MSGAASLTASMASFEVEQAISFETSQVTKERQRQRQRRMTWAVAGTSVASVLTAVVAMYVEASYVCYAAFLFPLLSAPYVIFQRRQINRLPTLVQEINLCRQLVNRMTIQNNRLEQENDKLTRVTGRLSASEQRLEQIASAQGVRVVELKALLRENVSTLQQIKQLQQARELQGVLTSMLQSDTNHDRHISEDELDRLSQRLQIFSNSRLPLDDGLLRQAFRMSGASAISTTTLFRWTTRLMEQNEQEEMWSVSGERGGLTTETMTCVGYQRCLD